MDSQPEEPPVCLDILLDLAVELFRPVYVLCSFLVEPTLRFLFSIPFKLKKKAQRAYTSPPVDKKCRLEGTAVDGVNCLPCNKNQDTESPFSKLTKPSCSQPNNIGKCCNPKDQYIEIPAFLQDLKPLGKGKCIDNYFDSLSTLTKELRDKQSIHNCPKIAKESNMGEFAPKNYWVHRKESQQDPKRGESVTYSVSSFSNPDLSSPNMQKIVAESGSKKGEVELRTNYQNFPGSNERSIHEDNISGPSNPDKGPPRIRYDDDYSYHSRGPPIKYKDDYYGPVEKYDDRITYKGPPKKYNDDYSYYGKIPPRKYIDGYSYYHRGPPPRKYDSYDYDDKGPPQKLYKSDGAAYGYRGKGPMTYDSRRWTPRSPYYDDDNYYYHQRYGANRGIARTSRSREAIPKTSRSPRKIASTSSIQTRTTSHPQRSCADHNIESLQTTTISISTMSSTASPSTVYVPCDTKLRAIKHTTPLQSQDLDEEDDDF